VSCKEIPRLVAVVQNDTTNHFTGQTSNSTDVKKVRVRADLLAEHPALRCEFFSAHALRLLCFAQQDPKKGCSKKK